MKICACLFLVVNLCHTLPSVLAAEESTVDRALRQSGIARGLAVFPRIADGIAPRELSARPGWICYAQDDSAQRASTLREWAGSAGLLCRRLYVEHRPDNTIPLADGVADLLVATDLGAGDLTAERLGEWKRVLIPGRGVAVLQLAAAPTPEAVARWGSGWQPLPVEPGTWLVLRRPHPAKSDEWTHRYHGADNCRLSGDQTVRPPFLPRWYGLPLQEGFWGTTAVAARGRLFTLYSSREPRKPVALVARSLGNGLELWRREFTWKEPIDGLSAGYYPGRSCLVAWDDEVLLIDGDHVLRLNGESGAERGTFMGPQPGKQLKWIAVGDGYLAMLAGEADRYKFLWQAQSQSPSGRWLSVCRLSDGQQVWTREEPGAVDEREIAARNGRVYYHVAQTGIVCRQLNSGESVWENKAPETLAAIGAVPSGLDLLRTHSSQPTLLVQDQALVFTAWWYANTVVFNAADGRMLWQKRLAKGWRCMPHLPIGDKWYSSSGTYELLTGKPLDSHAIPVSYCGTPGAMPGYFLTEFGGVLEIDSLRQLRRSDDKSPCDLGSVVSGGTVVNPSSECRCAFPIKGYRAFASAPPGFTPHAAGNASNRLFTASTAPQPANEKPDPADWPTWRHDNRRAAASPAQAGSSRNLLWHWQAPARPDQASAGILGVWAPTAPIAAGGRAWLGGADGILRQFNAATGELEWQYPLESKLFVSPTYANGRVYAGTANGDVVCLDVTTGKLLWRFRAAPLDRRMLWYGQLMGTWPVMGGVTVQDGVVYALAGYQEENGVHGYALDAATGTLRWERHDLGREIQPELPGSGSYGILALDGERGWWSSGDVHPASFLLKTGEPLPVLKSTGYERRFGASLLLLDRQWLLYGGRRFSSLQEEGAVPSHDESIMACPVTAPEDVIDPRVPACRWLDVSQGGWMDPSADETLVVTTSRRGFLTAYDRKLLVQRLTERLNDPTLPPTCDRMFGRLLSPPVAAAPANPPGATPPTPPSAQLWEVNDLVPQGFLLASDVVMVLVQNHLKAVARPSGATLWYTKLPGKALHHGLCVDRTGRVLVSLADGSLACYGPRAGQ